MEDFILKMRDDHREFDKGSLEGFFGNEPFDLFKQWYADAIASQPEPNAFVLSTVGLNNFPSSRVLYLKELLEKKFVFYTNYNSHKGKDLTVNPQASMLFFWPGLQRQVRIDGTVQKVSESVSDEYFKSRPRGSQIGAWASSQSDFLNDRGDLEKNVERFAKKFPKDVPRPPHWGGYELTPLLVEFWQGRPSRLHDRIIYEWYGNAWNVYRKNP
ncbi:MAG: pyridoxamine 5-phosphate oxidase [Bacteroidota bacterium]|jgi:pyridoxamine 5'-phosphate oxidase